MKKNLKTFFCVTFEFLGFWVVGATLFYKAHSRTRMEKAPIMITAAIEPTI